MAGLTAKYHKNSDYCGRPSYISFIVFKRYISVTNMMNLHLFKTYRLLILTCLIAAQFSAAHGQTVKKLDTLFQTISKQGIFNGCVLIAEDGKPIYQKAFGYAGLATKQLLDNNTVFELASVSKQFTAMAIMQLHQNHKLSYDDDVTKYFPELAAYKGVTLNHLLHHTSGFPEFLQWNDKQIDVNRINYNKDILVALAKTKPGFLSKPGDTFAYNNTNYVVLALIVEQVSGMPFAKYLDIHIFKPLKMNNTLVYGQRYATKKLSNYALGHLYDPATGGYVFNDSLVSNRFEYYLDGVAGPYGISSNTADMLKWDQALYTEKLVTKEEQELAYAPFKLNNGKQAMMMGCVYGFGWLSAPPKPYTGKIYWHSGGYPGYQSMIMRYPEKHKTIIILTNLWQAFEMYELAAYVEGIIFGKSLKIPGGSSHTKSITLSPAQLKIFDGVYAIKNMPQAKVIITSNGRRLFAGSSTSSTILEIYPESEDDFFYTVVDAKIKFIKNDKGIVDKLVYTQNGIQIEALKE